jgi:hypothetical protein
MDLRRAKREVRRINQEEKDEETDISFHRDRIDYYKNLIEIECD